MTTRLEEIQNRLDHHFETELGVHVVSMDAPRWLCTDLGPYSNFGWAYPFATNPDERSGDYHGSRLGSWADEYLSSPAAGPEPMVLVICYSPEVMADSTMQLTAKELDDYLTAVEYLIDRYVATRLDIEDPQRRVQAAEDDLYEVSSAALSLLSRVQMAALPPVSS